MLEVGAHASDEEVRAAYRRLVKRYHPDHNGGSKDAELRFEQVQEAYARVRALRSGARPGAGSSVRGARGGYTPPASSSDPAVEARLADLERELREAQEARERANREAQREAREAAQAADRRRASDEELGYIHTEDSFSKIMDDARSALGDWLSDARESPVAHRVEDLVDDLEQRARRTMGEPKDRGE